MSDNNIESGQSNNARVANFSCKINGSCQVLRLGKNLMKDSGNNVSCITMSYTEASNDELWLWTGESVYCNCSHHVTEHCTYCYQSTRLFHCHKCDGCEGFEATKTRPGTSVETEPLKLSRRELAS
jgi:hypothetical protein